MARQEDVIIRYDSRAHTADGHGAHFAGTSRHVLRQWLLRDIDTVTTLSDLVGDFWHPGVTPMVLDIVVLYADDPRSSPASRDIFRNEGAEFLKWYR